jgi:hypothetical protein
MTSAPVSVVLLQIVLHIIHDPSEKKPIIPHVSRFFPGKVHSESWVLALITSLLYCVANEPSSSRTPMPIAQQNPNPDKVVNHKRVSSMTSKDDDQQKIPSRKHELSSPIQNVPKKKGKMRKENITKVLEGFEDEMTCPMYVNQCISFDSRPDNSIPDVAIFCMCSRNLDRFTG